MCNRSVSLSQSNDVITIHNITSDVQCGFYATSVLALENLDNTADYLLFLKDEGSSNLVINEEKELTVDFNGHTKSGMVSNAGNLKLLSSANEMGILENSDAGAISSTGTSSLLIQNMKVTTNLSTIHTYDQTDLKIYSSQILSTDDGRSSSVWLHGGNGVCSVYNSYISGPYAIGGEGGTILVDNSELLGVLHVGLQTNRNFYGDVTITGNSKVTGEKYGIQIYYGMLTLTGENESQPKITGNTLSGLNIGVETPSVLNYYYGTIYGMEDINVNGTIHLRDNATMQTVTENRMKKTYLQ